MSEGEKSMREKIEEDLFLFDQCGIWRRWMKANKLFNGEFGFAF